MPKLEKEGTYIATVTDVRQGESNKGTPFLQLTFETEDGHHIWKKCYLTAAALAHNKQAIEACFGKIDDLDEIAEICTGKQCRIVCQSKEYEGKTRLEVAFINPLSYAPPPMATNTQAKVKALWKATPSIVRGPASAPRQTAPAAQPRRPAAPPPPANDDDDIPF